MVLRCKILDTSDVEKALEFGGVVNVGTMPLSGVSPPPNGGGEAMPELGVVIGVVPPAELKLHGGKTVVLIPIGLNT